MTLQPWLDQANAIAPAFIDAAIRGAVVLLLALALTWALRRNSAAARHLVWVGAIAVQLALPLFALWGPQWHIVVPESVASVMPVEIPTEALAPLPSAGPSRTARSSEAKGSAPQAMEQPGVGPSPRTGRDIGSADPRAVSPRTLLIVLWLAGAFIVLARLAIGTTVVAALARHGARVVDGNWLSLTQKLSTALHIDRPLTLLRGDRLGVPITWGIVYPVVLLPDDSDTWPEERRRFVLVHEMAHVKRLDALTQLAGQLALALFWFDPLVWIANRRMQLEREHACDDYVIRHGTTPSLYAEELLSMVRSLGTPGHRSAQPAFAALAMARRSEFEGRMLSILDPIQDRLPLSRGRTLMSALAALGLIVPLAALHPYQGAQPPTAQDAAFTAAASSLVAGMKELRVGLNGDATALERAKGALDVLPSSFKVHITAVAPAATAAMAAATVPTTASPSCDAMRFDGSDRKGTSVHADDDGGSRSTMSYASSNANHCSSAVIVGRLVFTGAEDDVVSMPFGSHAVFRERSANDDRVVSLSPAEDGGITRAYRRNGVGAAWDDDAKQWFAGFLPLVLSEAGVNVRPRVARWRAQGGLDNALSHIATLASSSAKRSHYEALFDGGGLSGDDLDEVVRSASQTLRGSSSDMREILTRAAVGIRLSANGTSALEAATTSMGSSSDKAAVLEAFGSTDDRAILLAVMRAAKTIPSSGDLSRLLESLVSRYLGGSDRALHAAFFETAVTVPSSGDLQSLLEAAIPYCGKSDELGRLLIESARAVPSSGDRAELLIAIIERGVVRSKTIRDLFVTVASELPSEGDRSRVLQAAARH